MVNAGLCTRSPAEATGKIWGSRNLMQSTSMSMTLKGLTVRQRVCPVAVLPSCWVMLHHPLAKQVELRDA